MQTRVQITKARKKDSEYGSKWINWNGANFVSLEATRSHEFGLGIDG